MIRKFGNAIKTVLRWLVSGSFFVLFLIPVTLSILSLLKIDKYEAIDYIFRLSNPITSLASFSVDGSGLQTEDMLTSSVLQQYFEPTTMLDFRRNVYEITENSMIDLQSILFHQESKWKHVKYGVDYHIEAAPITSLPIKNQNQSIYYAHRCKFNVTTSLTRDELIQFFAEEENSNVFFATKDIAFKKYSPVYSFEWFNGSLDVIHVPLLSPSKHWRKELVALRAVNRRHHTILWQGLQRPSLSLRDLQLIIAQHHNIRNDPHPLPILSESDTGNWQQFNRRFLLQMFVGVHIRDLSDKKPPAANKPQRTTHTNDKNDDSSDTDVPNKFELTVFRYSSNLQSFPWIEWYVSSYLYFPTVIVRLKNMVGNAELKKQVEDQLKQQQKQKTKETS